MSGGAANDRNSFATILICNNLLLRVGLKHLLENTCFAVSDTVFDETAPWRHHFSTPPALFIVDASNSSEELLAIIERLKQRLSAAKIVLVADQFDVRLVRRGFAVGVDGFCSAARGREVLIKSLELVMMGERILPGALVRSMLSQVALTADNDQDRPMAEPLPFDPGMHKLSSREAEILRCIMQGEPNKVIARKLDVAEATIKVHVKAILRKIGVANRTQAAIWATEHLPKKQDRS
jgi:two-component system nitrate/nitrite response regulator NarL